MGDNEFRPEFTQQMIALRNRILKKTKPKLLNGKNLTGPMLYELCHAYTEAINKGSVPNIQSAWQYVCQNESMRTIQTCLNSYIDQMREIFENSK